VAGLEFPAECGGCDPQSCPQEVTTPAPTASTCECTSCTAEVLATSACDQHGCFSCGDRLNWLMNDESGPLLTENDACIRLASIDFPNGPCGPACDPTRCNTNVSPTSIPTGSPTQPPSDAPTSNPTATPTFAPVSATPTGTPTDSPTVSPIEDGPNPCSYVSCTQDVINAYAGEFTCGARIDWLQTLDGGSYSELASCSMVAAAQFPQECGLCDPSTCNPVYLPDPDLAKLVWSDEFDVDGALESTRWTYDIGGGGWGNNELQCYTNRSDNLYISNGKLHVKAVKETYGKNSFTSARAVTRGLGDWTYGRVRVMARLEKCTGVGTWHAIWMPTDWYYGGWPASGEIDIMEHVG